MVKIKSQNKISFFNTPAIVALFSVLCALSGVFLPFLIRNNTLLTFIDIFKFNYISVNLILLFIIFLILLAYFIDIFIEPGWFSYFVNASISVILCVAPVFLAYFLSKKLGISQFAIKIHAGGILMMIASMVFAGIEIYRLSTIEKKSADRIFLTNKNFLKRIYYCKKNTLNADKLLEKMQFNKVDTKNKKTNKKYMKNILKQSVSKKQLLQNKRANKKSINTTTIKFKNSKAIIKQIKFDIKDYYYDDEEYYDEYLENEYEKEMKNSPKENKLFESIKNSQKEKNPIENENKQNFENKNSD